MLTGRFGNTTGSAYIEAHIHFPRFNIKNNISFLVDTGAAATQIMPADVNRIGINYHKLSNKIETRGVGGKSYSFFEPALILFDSPEKKLYVYKIKILISRFDKELEILPSILGRDILKFWRMDYHPQGNLVTFKVLYSDQMINLKNK